MSVFDEATAIRPAGPGRYQVRPDERFAIVAPGNATPSAVNGGVMVATVLRAVLDSSPLPYPVATSAHFLRVPLLEPGEVEVTWLKQGKTAATARAALVQDSQIVLDATVTTGSLPAELPPTAPLPADPRPTRPLENGDLRWTGEPPKMPPIEECVNLGPWRGTVGTDGVAGYAAQVDLRMDPATTGWRRGEPSGVPEMRGYFSLREQRDPDAYLLAVAVDALPPVVFGLGALGWAPTVELTWHMRAVPAPGPLQVVAWCRHVSGGWFDGEAEVWDAAGRLVAQGRQIARVGRSRRKEA
jgi:Acyl-CoA thioesterase C-terminal domain/Acyl-CoA thioesterase N-terminal domain